MSEECTYLASLKELWRVSLVQRPMVGLNKWTDADEGEESE